LVAANHPTTFDPALAGLYLLAPKDHFVLGNEKHAASHL
jgi:hypothetical protein